MPMNPIHKLLASRWVPLPHSLVLEVTSFCNLRCRMCPKTHGAVNTPENCVMSKDVFKKVSRLFPQVSAVELSGLWGEVFMHPDLYLYMLEELKRHPIVVSTISNGTLLKDETARRLVELGLDRLVVSMDAATPETYAHIRPPGKLEDVVRGLESVLKWKQALGKSLPRVELVFLGMHSNIQEFPEFVRLAQKVGAAKVSLQALGEYELVRGESVAKNYKELGRRIFAEAAEVAKASGMEIELFPCDQFDEARGDRNAASGSARLYKHCLDPWTKVVITTSGDVLPCCSGTRPLGNVLHQDLETIWYGDGYAGLREMIRTCNPPGMCRACTGMPWARQSLRKDLQLAGYLAGIKLNRRMGKSKLYQAVKPTLKRVRNALVGRGPGT